MGENLMKIKRNDKLSAYVLYVLANCCMPVMLKKKTAAIINFKKRYILLNTLTIILKKELEKFNTDFDIICEDADNIFVFVYNTDMLCEVIEDEENRKLLDSLGYGHTKGYKEVLGVLYESYSGYKQGMCKFPDEIGIFLGYPLEDVVAYINNKGENFLLSGCWKVYSDLENAVKTFEMYKLIKEAALNTILNGGELTEVKAYGIQ